MEEKLTQMRSYWLGRQSESERTAFENLWFETDEDAELLTAVRDDLIEDYLSNDLTTEESSQFKTFFLGELGMSQEVGIAAAIRDAGPNRSITVAAPESDKRSVSSLLIEIKNLVSSSLVPAAAGAFLVVVVVGGFIGYQLANEATTKPIAQIDPPIFDQSSPTPETGNMAIHNQPPPQRELAKGQKDKNTPRMPDGPRGPRNDSFDLSDAITMGPGEMPSKDLPDSVETLTLKLARPLLKPQFNEKYSYRIAPIGSSTGTVSGPISQDLNKLTSDDSFMLTVPATQLRSGRYELTFFGQNAAGQNERLSSLKFRINRSPTK